MTPTERWTLAFSAHCAEIERSEVTCQVCGDTLATGHVTVQGGPHDGRCIAVVCELHASLQGWPAFRSRLTTWFDAGLFDLDGGPGADGSPEVWHRDHLDPLPSTTHGAGW